MVSPAENPFRHLRVVRSAVLSEYLANTAVWRSVGNRRFGALVGESDDGAALAGARPGATAQFEAPFVLYHAWLPGFVEVSGEDARLAAELARGAPRSREHDALAAELAELGWAAGGEVDIDALVEQMQRAFIAIQNRREAAELLRLVARKRPRVVVEIGSARGGMLFAFSQLADPGAELVSIDLPGAPNGGGQTAVERELFTTFGPPAQRFHFIPSSSLFWTTRERLRAILDGRAIDLLFIDGDHSYGGVRSDFEMYRELVAPDGLLALHDICMFPEEWGPGNEVGVFWQEVRARHRTREIIDASGTSRRAKRADQRWAWGIGIVEDPHGA